ncbi:hypothetical protein [Actinomadura sp. KC06]|uniref:hypothetical protein n=1 Tax=Actinomadura sp. KC06 TaxID=2530369 RepID=UPI001FB66256|nr:hypothetical protein [Actinomadura sp. KC06]
MAFVIDTRECRSVADVVRYDGTKQLRSGENGLGVVPFIDHDQAGKPILGQQPGGLGGAAVRSDGGKLDGEFTCAHGFHGTRRS